MYVGLFWYVSHTAATNIDMYPNERVLLQVSFHLHMCVMCVMSLFTPFAYASTSERHLHTKEVSFHVCGSVLVSIGLFWHVSQHTPASQRDISTRERFLALVSFRVYGSLLVYIGLFWHVSHTTYIPWHLKETTTLERGFFHWTLLFCIGFLSIYRSVSNQFKCHSAWKKLKPWKMYDE